MPALSFLYVRQTIRFVVRYLANLDNKSEMNEI